MRKLYTSLCVTVLCAGVFVFAKGTLAKSESEPYPAVPFEVTYLVTTTDAKGETRQSTRVRQVQANGEWRETYTSRSGREVTTANLPEGASIHGSDEQTRTRLNGNFPNEDMLRKYRTPAFLQKMPYYVGTEEIAGLKVYVTRQYLDGTDVEFIEKAYSPRTGLTPLRFYVKDRAGSSEFSEAIKVEFKEVPSNDDLRALPVKERTTP